MVAMVGAQMIGMLIEEGMKSGVLSEPVPNGNEGTILIIEE